MKKTIYLLGLVSITFACSTSGSKQSNETVPVKTTEEAIVETSEETLKVLNPNLASAEELASTLGVEISLIDSLLIAKPILDPIAFLSSLKEIVGEEAFDEAKTKVFLPMNLNTTAESDFKLVPGVGDKMAHEFEEYRPYTSIEQFRREIGKYVDEEEVARYEQYVFVPLNLNEASEEEILAVPGVGKKMAHEFEEYRPYSSLLQFRREIGKYVDDNELARLERYVTLGE